MIESSDSDDDADTDDRTDDGICDADYADDDGNDYDDIVDDDYVDDDVDDDDDHDDTGDVDADACAEYDAVDADVVDGVDIIVANGRHGEVEPVADADGIRDVQGGFESAANGWLPRVATLDPVYYRSTCCFATMPKPTFLLSLKACSTPKPTARKGVKAVPFFWYCEYMDIAEWLRAPGNLSLKPRMQ